LATRVVIVHAGRGPRERRSIQAERRRPGTRCRGHAHLTLGYHRWRIFAVGAPDRGFRSAHDTGPMRGRHDAPTVSERAHTLVIVPVDWGTRWQK